MRKSLLLLAGTIIAAVLLAALPGSALAATPAAGNLRVALDTYADFSNLARTSTRHNYVILQPWQTSQLAQIKAADPSTKVIVHKNLSGASPSNNNGIYSTGVSYQEADSEHPEWFLKDSSGQRITFINYSSLHAMDIGNPAYQQRWADNVVAELVEKGFDGVMLDNTDTTMKNDFAKYPAKYPNDGAWRAATESALAHIGPRIEAAGKLAIPNIGGWGGNPDIGRDWLEHVSGGVDEMFLKWGNTAGEGYAWEGRWRDQLASLRYAQQHGKDYLAVTHSAASDRGAARYGYATLLLGAAGRASFSLAADYTQETWFPEYDYQLGSPQGAVSEESSGVHRRTFSNGIVLVNPTADPKSVQLGGTFSGSELNAVSSVTLAPQSAFIGTGSGGGSDGSGDDGGGSGGGSDGSGGDGGGSGGGSDGSGSGSEDGSDSSGGESGGGDSVEIEPRGKRAKKGARIVAKGRLKDSSTYAARSASSPKKVRVRAVRLGGGGTGRVVATRRDGRFKARLRVCRPGRYKLVAKHGGEKRRYPGTVKVRRKQVRC